MLADSAYTRDRKLRAYFRARGIVASATPLGRPPADLDARAAYEGAKGRPGERNRIQGWFGVAKRRYGLARLMCRTAATTAAEVYLKVMAVNLAGALARGGVRLRDRIAHSSVALSAAVAGKIRGLRRYDMVAMVFNAIMPTPCRTVVAKRFNAADVISRP